MGTERDSSRQIAGNRNTAPRTTAVATAIPPNWRVDTGWRSRAVRPQELVPAGVVLVGVLPGVTTGERHHKVRDQVRKRVDAIGHHALRLGQDADGDLGDRQEQIDANTGPGVG